MGIYDPLTAVKFKMPRVFPNRDVPSAPEEQGDIQEEGDEQRHPHPEKSSEESVDQVLFTDPTPILVNPSAYTQHLKQSIIPEMVGRRRSIRRGRRFVERRHI
jgi:hypothetical protein